MKILALDLGGSSIKHGLVVDGALVGEARACPSGAALGGEHLLAAALAAAGQYEGFERIGISTSGQADPASGHIVYANRNIPGYTGTALRRVFEERFGLPVAVENDVNAAALGELHHGAAKGCEDFLMLTYGTGIGGAIVLGGEIYGGARHVAGEMGHLVTHFGGRPCACGAKGCYEQYASARRLAQSAREAGLPWQSGEELLAHPEHPAAAEVLAAWQAEVAAGLVSLVHVFNPPLVLLGGGVMEAPGMLEAIRALVAGQVMESFGGVQLAVAALGNTAGLLGAAWLARAL